MNEEPVTMSLPEFMNLWQSELSAIITDKESCIDAHTSKASSDQAAALSNSDAKSSKRPMYHGGSRRRKERNIILVTFLFSVNFVTWNFIILYYYFYYIIEPKRGVFTTMAKGNKLVLTYLNGWFYYATFMTSCINPIIHFICNSKMRGGFCKLFTKKKWLLSKGYIPASSLI